MKKFLRNLQVICTTMFMTTILAVNASAAIPEENILLDIDDDGFVSYEEETYTWQEGWNMGTTTGKVNCVKEGTKVRFSLTKPTAGNAVLDSAIYKLDGNMITHVSDGAGAIIQRGLSADTPVEINFSKDELNSTVYFWDSDGNGIEENSQFSTSYLYVFTVRDWDDENTNQTIPSYVIRIDGESTTSEPVTPEPVASEPVASEPVTSEPTVPEIVAPQTSVGDKFIAVPNTVSLSLTENTTNMRAYSINNTDYFSLRDIASLLNGTEQQFDIQYDKTTKTVALTTQKPYALANTDYTNNSNMTQREVTSTTVILNVDGQNISSVAYNIDGTNYFSIADLNKFIPIAD